MQQRAPSSAFGTDQATSPVSLTEFFAGRTRAWGIFEDRMGQLRRRFDVEIVGAWEGDVFVMTEDFIYDDGKIEQRVWRVTPGRSGDFSATFSDVVGVAKGQHVGDQIKLSYDAEIPINGRKITFSFKDRMYPVGVHGMLNRATMSKFGVRVGEITIWFEKVEEGPSAAYSQAA